MDSVEKTDFWRLGGGEKESVLSYCGNVGRIAEMGKMESHEFI